MRGQPIAGALTASLTEEPSDRVAALFDFHYPRIYRLARRLTGSSDDALDLVQETFLRAAQSIASLPHGREREEAWLIRVLINLRRDEWRRAAVRRRHDALRIQPGLQPDHGSAAIARATIWRALQELPPRRRAVIVMHELEGLTVSTIALQLGISAITVRWHLSAGRRQLTRLLTPRGGGS